jgi:hypothetical protein
VSGSAEMLIAVNGWLGQREDFLRPFQSLPRRQGILLTISCVSLVSALPLCNAFCVPLLV